MSGELAKPAECECDQMIETAKGNEQSQGQMDAEKPAECQLTEKKQSQPQSDEKKQRQKRKPRQPKEKGQPVLERPKRKPKLTEEPPKIKKVKKQKDQPSSNSPDQPFIEIPLQNGDQIEQETIQVVLTPSDEMVHWRGRLQQVHEAIKFVNELQQSGLPFLSDGAQNPNSQLINPQLKKIKNSLNKIVRLIEKPKTVVGAVPQNEVKINLMEIQVPEEISPQLEIQVELSPPIVVDTQVKPQEEKIEKVAKPQNQNQRSLNGWVKQTVLQKKQLNEVSKVEIFKSLGCRPQQSLPQEKIDMLEQQIKGSQLLNDLTLNDHIQNKELEIKQSNVRRERRVHVYIFDCTKILRGVIFTKRSTTITGRKPFNQDDNCIDYELNSEDELNAESITGSEKEEEEEDSDSSSLSGNGTIVPDEYISYEEGFQQEQPEDNSYKESLKLSQQINQKFYEEGARKPFSYLSNCSHLDIFLQCQIIAIDNQTFPMATKKVESKQHTFFDIEENMRNFIIFVCGSYSSLQNLSLQFNEQNKNCSRYRIEKKIKEIAEKQKNENTINKERWVVKNEYLTQYGISMQDSIDITNAKEAEFIQARQIKVEKRRQESERKRLMLVDNEPPQQQELQENIFRYLKQSAPPTPVPIEKQ